MAATQNRPIVITLDESKGNEKYRYGKLFPKRCMLTFGILQLICGGLVAVTQVILLLVVHSNIRQHGFTNAFLSAIGSGIWCGLFFGIAGILGIVASYKTSKSILVAYLVMSIIASAFVIPLMVFASFGISSNSWRYDADMTLCLYSLQALIGFAQAVIAITSAGYSCRALCCGGPKNSSAGGIVFYNQEAGSSNPAAITVIPLNNLPTSPAAGSSNPSSITVIPINNLQTAPLAPEVQALLGATTNTTTTSDNPPPDYDKCTAEQPPQKGQKYQRF